METIANDARSDGTNQIPTNRENSCLRVSEANGVDPPLPPLPPPSTSFPPSAAVIPDGGYGWVVVFASMWYNGCILGIQNSFSILHVMLTKEYEEPGGHSQFKVAWVGALSMAMVFFCSPLASIFTDRFGCRKTAGGGALLAFAGLLATSYASSLSLCYFTYGVLFGCGSSFAFQPSLVILGHYFHGRLGLASGVVTAASSLFTMGFPVLLEEAVAPLGLGATFRVLSIFLLILVPLSLAFRPPPSAEPHLGVQPASSSPSPPVPGPRGAAGLSEYCNLKVFGVTTYRRWLFGVALATLGYFVPTVHLVSFAEEKFEGTHKSWILLVCVSSSSCAGRLIFGKAMDLFGGVKKIVFQAASFMVMGLVLATLPLCRTFEALAAACILQGLCDGCFLSSMAPIVFELVGQRLASQAIGYLLGLLALPMIAGPPVAGLLHDHFGNYDVAFHLTGVPIIVGSLQLFLVLFTHWRAQGGEPEHGACPEPVPTLSANIADKSAIPGLAYEETFM